MATAPEQDLRALAQENLDAPSLCHAFQATAAALGDATALRAADGSDERTWAQYSQAVEAVAGGLASLGVGHGSTVGLMLANRVEFHLVDTAAMHLGAAPYSIYSTNPADAIVPLLKNSDAHVVVTEQSMLDRVLKARELQPTLEHVVVIDGEAPEGVIHLDDLVAQRPDGFDFEAAWQAVGQEDLLTLVYTSGTTGDPKGVQHTHGTIMANLRSYDAFCPVTPKGRIVSYLPAAHIAERYISHYGSIVNGHTITAVSDPAGLAAALGATKPTRFMGVPRVYEKLRGAVLSMASAEPEGPLAQAIERGVKRVQDTPFGEAMPEPSDEDAKVLAGVRAKLGLDEAEWVAVAAAPSPIPMLEFFPALGVDLCEFWGMSECTYSTSNPYGGTHRKIGTIGKPIPGVEVKLAEEDNEILVRGGHITTGYRNEPEKTAEALDADGWLHTGDVGEFDEDGYLKIVDRKKELIINSAGKNMSPAHIETAIKTEDPLIAYVVAIGDGKQYVTAMVVLDEEALTRDGKDVATAAEDPAIQERIAAAVAKGNDKLARVEQIKKHVILPEGWAPGGDELTPTFKLKRKPINDKYASEIDGLYA